LQSASRFTLVQFWSPPKIPGWAALMCAACFLRLVDADLVTESLKRRCYIEPTIAMLVILGVPRYIERRCRKKSISSRARFFL